MVNLGPALLSDLRRPWLWKGSAISAALALGLTGMLFVAATHDAGADTTGLPALLLDAVTSLVLTVSAVFGSFSFTADYRAGSLNRRVLLFQRRPAFLGRALSTAVAALLAGAAIGLAFGFASAVLKVAGTLSPSLVLAFAGAAAMGALWGFALGSLLRNHLVSLFAVPLSVALPGLLPDLSQPMTTFFFPVLAANWAQQAAVNIPASGAFCGAAGWLVLVAAAAFTVFVKRDLA
ncbi:hypothetical protein NEK97_09465 [Paenarthrobacter sp. UW852]|uniref:hypothetical protein n=1 Tax=Paenarthrobacter sp. UW852 TaxID=2951989 RepID=UPI0021490EFC|nr:hypothetical protein [Paenarthrobacter sp. UW852]MCR1161686.1 hypothetical protein [Paenarthrobacter sp. UW852]